LTIHATVRHSLRSKEPCASRQKVPQPSEEHQNAFHKAADMQPGTMPYGVAHEVKRGKKQGLHEPPKATIMTLSLKSMKSFCQSRKGRLFAHLEATKSRFKRRLEVTN
jgi:hypothetical protein